MKIHCKYDELVSPNALVSHPKNRNKHPEDQIKRLAEVLGYQGWRYAVKVSKRSGYVTSGHGRIEAALYKDWQSVPVVYQDYESEEQEYADLVADNAIADWADLDRSGINTDLGDLGPDFEVNMLGIKDFEIEVADKIETEKPKKKKEETKECPSCGYSF